MEINFLAYCPPASNIQHLWTAGFTSMARARYFPNYQISLVAELPSTHTAVTIGRKNVSYFLSCQGHSSFCRKYTREFWKDFLFENVCLFRALESRLQTIRILFLVCLVNRKISFIIDQVFRKRHLTNIFCNVVKTLWNYIFESFFLKGNISTLQKRLEISPLDISDILSPKLKSSERIGDNSSHVKFTGNRTISKPIVTPLKRLKVVT